VTFLKAKLDEYIDIQQREIFEYSRDAANIDFNKRCAKANDTLLKASDMLSNTVEQIDYLNCLELTGGDHIRAVEIYEGWDIIDIAGRMELHLARHFRDVNDKGV